MTSTELKTDGSAYDRGFIHVEISRLDVLLNLVGELVINRGSFTKTARIARNKHGFKEHVLDLTETVEQLGRIIEGVQDKVIASRMVSMGHLFERFAPMIRQLNTTSGKSVELELLGKDTEVDKKIADALSEPLVHLVRNAFDHGIETEEERVDAGKSAHGTITLMAGHDGNKLKISITDDGGGIDPEKVAAVALEKQLVTADRIADMSDDAKRELIFVPGFSTGTMVSQLSGRGVGMDAAKRAVETLGGRLHIRSETGSGTTCTIVFPLTMAIIPGLFFSQDGEQYALPVDSVDETLQLTSADIGTVKQMEVIELRGDVLPLVRAATLLDTTGEAKMQGYGIVIRTHNEKFCLFVDQLIGRQEIVIKPLKGGLDGIGIIAGATVVGDGSVLIVLDPDGIGAKIR